MAICENCGDSVELISFDEFCADCEHLQRMTLQKKAEESIRKLLYIKEVFDEGTRKTIARNCEDCVFAGLRNNGLDLICSKYHRPRFYQPKSGDFTSGNWGWRRNCSDFRYTKVVENQLIKNLME